MTWLERAACHGQGTDGPSVWTDPHEHTTEQIRAALSLCARCPVAGECLASEPLPVGIRGGKVWTTGHAGRPAESRPRLCLVCNRVFFPQGASSCCSPVCRGIKARETPRPIVRPQRVCIVCTKVFEAAHGNMSFCSSACAAVHTRKRQRAKDVRRGRYRSGVSR